MADVQVLAAELEAGYWSQGPRGWSLKVTVDRLPAREDMAFHRAQTAGGFALAAELDGIVRYVWAKQPVGHPKGACGGWFMLASGESILVEDGWTSRAGVINDLFLGLDVVDVSIRTPQSGVYYSGGIGLRYDLAEQAAEMADGRLNEDREGAELKWDVEPVWFRCSCGAVPWIRTPGKSPSGESVGELAAGAARFGVGVLCPACVEVEDVRRAEAIVEGR